jgi:hypothetical protein
MGLFDGQGMQMMLANMVKSAAPDLIEKVEQFQQVVLSFKAQLDHIQTQQTEILRLLQESDDNGSIGTNLERHSGPAGEIGRPSGQ